MSQRVCSTDYMLSSLQCFSLDEIRNWHAVLAKIDAAIRNFVVRNLDFFKSNGGMVPSELVEPLRREIANRNMLEWNPSTLQAFEGYRVYEFPDGGNARNRSGNPDLWYGLAMAESYGQVHIHLESNAYNLVVSGKGIFRGEPGDSRFANNYHGDLLIEGKELEIPIGMPHGHDVSEGSQLWILFVQECGFRQGLRCAGDFHTIQPDSESASLNG